MRRILCQSIFLFSLIACSHAEIAPSSAPAPAAPTGDTRQAQITPVPATATGRIEKAPQPAPILFDDLGDHHHAISTRVPEAQKYFDQGLRLVYAFNHDEATRAFRQGASLDATCAMCFWGVALSLGPNINLPTDSDREKMAWDAIDKAQATAASATEVERDYIAALAKRYAKVPTADRKALDVAYADAMRALADKYPDDEDAATLFAEAMMDLRPWSLWNYEGQPQPGTEEILTTLEEVLKKNPRHPGANHYYIHAVEASPHPEKGLPSADRLPSLMPGAGHIVHMPGHIYIHTGRYADATKANERAIEVDKTYLAKAKPPPGIYTMMYVAHNFYFLWFSASMEGRSAEALKAAREMVAHFSPAMIRAMQFQMPGMDYFLAPPLFALARFGKWQELLAEPPPPVDFKYLSAVWHFGQGLAFAATGKYAQAEEELRVLHAFKDSLPADAMLGPLNSARAVFAVAERMLTGEISARRGDTAEAIKILKWAVEAEDQLAYDEPPPWYQPVRHSLGAVLLHAGKYEDAEKVYREDLRRNPENGWALWGLQAALKKRRADTRETAARFTKAWARSDVSLVSSRF